MAAEITIEFDFCGGRGNLAASKRGGSGVIYVVVVNECRGRSDSRRRVGRRSPSRLAFGTEVRERSSPSINGDHVHDGIPVKGVHGEIRIVYGGICGRETGAVQVGFRADGQSLQIHFQAAINGPLKCAYSELWQD